MTTTNSLQILTKQGEELLARLAAEEKELVIDKFIFADVQDRNDFPSRDETIPSDYVVHNEMVGDKGRLTANSVIYTATLASNVGPFYFNWSGLYCSEHDVLVTVHYPKRTEKTVDQPGVAGNTLVRSQVLQYTGVAEITNITVDASTWQYNATPRMKKMDDDVAQANIDQNGKDWFIEEGFLVTPQSSAFSIKAGAGYVSGNRVALDFDRSIQVPNKPSFIYIDAHREGTPTGEQVTLFNFVVSAEEKDDYIDSSTGKDVPHFVCKIAQVLGDGSVSDLRPLEAIKSWVAQQNQLRQEAIIGQQLAVKSAGPFPTPVTTQTHLWIDNILLMAMSPTPESPCNIKNIDLSGATVTFTDDTVSKLVGGQYTVPTVEDMRNRSFPLRSMIRTQGYYFVGDGGAASYQIIAASDLDYSPDDVVDHAVKSGQVAMMQFDNHPLAEQIGVRLFSNKDDSSYENYEAGVVLNAAIANPRVHGVYSRKRGYTYLAKTVVIDKPFELNLGGLEWAGASGGAFEFDVDDNIDQDAAIIVKSGTRSVRLKHFRVIGRTRGAVGKGIQIGDSSYESNKKNICSGIHCENISVENCAMSFFYWQIFLSRFVYCSARYPTTAGFWAEEGGTSLLWDSCATLGGEYGFAWNPAKTTNGHIYSSMINCVPQLTTKAAFLLRDSTITFVGCGQEFCSETIFQVQGSGSYSIDSFNNVNKNADKPKRIFLMEPNNQGRFGASLSLQAMTTSVTSFSGDKVQFMEYGEIPSSVLSSSKWTIPEAALKSDSTDCLDRSTWRSGYYYRQFMPLHDSAVVFEEYLRNNHAVANIGLALNTDYVIYVDVRTSQSTGAYLKLGLTLGSKDIVSSARLNILDAVANDGSGRGLILHCDMQTESAYSTGNLYLLAYSKAGCDMFASVSGNVLKLDFEVDGQPVDMTGRIIIEKKDTTIKDATENLWL